MTGVNAQVSSTSRAAMLFGSWTGATADHACAMSATSGAASPSHPSALHLHEPPPAEPGAARARGRGLSTTLPPSARSGVPPREGSRGRGAMDGSPADGWEDELGRWLEPFLARLRRNTESG